jgi:hypothetical protein
MRSRDKRRRPIEEGSSDFEADIPAGLRRQAALEPLRPTPEPSPSLGHPAGFADYAAAAWLANSMATVVGAIGSGLETDDEVRETISRYRPERSHE